MICRSAALSKYCLCVYISYFYIFLFVCLFAVFFCQFHLGFNHTPFSTVEMLLFRRWIATEITWPATSCFCASLLSSQTGSSTLFLLSSMYHCGHSLSPLWLVSRCFVADPNFVPLVDQIFSLLSILWLSCDEMYFFFFCSDTADWLDPLFWF